MANFIENLWNGTVQLLENLGILTKETATNWMEMHKITDANIRNLVNTTVNKLRYMKDVNQNKLDELWLRISELSNSSGSPSLNDYIAKVKREAQASINNIRKDQNRLDAMEETVNTTADDFRNTSTNYKTAENQDWKDLKNEAAAIDKLYEERINNND